MFGLTSSDWQAKECQNHITDAFETAFQIHAVLGRKNIEVRPQSASKLSALKTILSRYKDADHALYIGDERSDEECFGQISQMQTESGSQVKRFISCTVGNKSSNASYFAIGVTDVLNILYKMAMEQA